MRQSAWRSRRQCRWSPNSDRRTAAETAHRIRPIGSTSRSRSRKPSASPPGLECDSGKSHRSHRPHARHRAALRPAAGRPPDPGQGAVNPAVSSILEPPSLSLPHKGGGNAVARAFVTGQVSVDERSVRSIPSATRSARFLAATEDMGQAEPLLRFPPPCGGGTGRGVEHVRLSP